MWTVVSFFHFFEAALGSSYLLSQDKLYYPPLGMPESHFIFLIRGGFKASLKKDIPLCLETKKKKKKQNTSLALNSLPDLFVNIQKNSTYMVFQMPLGRTAY